MWGADGEDPAVAALGLFLGAEVVHPVDGPPWRVGVGVRGEGANLTGDEQVVPAGLEIPYPQIDSSDGVCHEPAVGGHRQLRRLLRRLLVVVEEHLWIPRPQPPAEHGHAVLVTGSIHQPTRPNRLPRRLGRCRPACRHRRGRRHRPILRRRVAARRQQQDRRQQPRQPPRHRPILQPQRPAARVRARPSSPGSHHSSVRDRPGSAQGL